jgi:hypothetical protein
MIKIRNEKKEGGIRKVEGVEEKRWERCGNRNMEGCGRGRDYNLNYI